MKIDIIIPVYKPGKELDELLIRLLKQTKPIHRIIIMNTEQQYWDNEKQASLFENSKTELLVYHLTKAEFDHGKTRHEGFVKSDADICVCMTQDAIPRDKRLIEHLVQSMLTDDDIAVAYARQLPATNCGVIERCTREFNYPKESRIKSQSDLENLGIKTYFCSNVCAAYRRDIYLKLGGFTQKTIFNEDMIYAANAVKVGYKIAYAAEAEVIHSHNYTAMEQLHRNFDLAVSQADHPEVFAGISSEGEGFSMVKTTAVRLFKKGKWYLLPDLVIKSGFKYMGYLLGRNYGHLPGSLIMKLTMNKEYWNHGGEHV
ncbi:MAG: glycosyltransferase family 2 protein [Clostridium sp.]